MESRLPGMIKDAHNFKTVLICLSSQECATVCIAVKDRLSKIIKNADDFKMVLHGLNPQQRIAVCQGIQEQLSQVIQLNELLKFFPDDFLKRKVQQLFFVSLLQEAKMKSFEFNNDENDVKARTAVEALYTVLRGVSQTYFKIENPAPDDESNFHTFCTAVVDKAKQALKDYPDWKDFFAKLALTIVSFGIIPAALSVTSKLQTDSWGWGGRFFKTTAESELEKISGFVNQMVVPG